MNVSFIGMSGSGKSFVGELLAHELGWRFFDVDREMEKIYGKPLQQILDTLGDAQFLREQADAVLALGGTQHTVIAPGGSVVYSSDVMDFLAEISTIVYLEASFELAQSRIQKESRGIVGLGDKTLRELYQERKLLYAQYADVTISVDDKTYEDIRAEIPVKI